MYAATQWYSHNPRAGAIYIGTWSFHWSIDGPVVVLKGKVEHIRQRPRRCIVIYRKHLDTLLEIPLWRHRGFCPHGLYKRNAWWHRCSLVNSDNLTGRIPDDELRLEEA